MGKIDQEKLHDLKLYREDFLSALVDVQPLFGMCVCEKIMVRVRVRVRVMGHGIGLGLWVSLMGYRLGLWVRVRARIRG